MKLDEWREFVEDNENLMDKADTESDMERLELDTYRELVKQIAHGCCPNPVAFCCMVYDCITKNNNT